MIKLFILWLFTLTNLCSEERKSTFAFDIKKWNEVRENIKLGHGDKYEIKKSTQKVVERTKGLEFALPEANLSILGRKFISAGVRTVSYHERPELSRTTLDMDQELQVRLGGNIADRIHVGINFNDKTGTQDISLTYKGKADEVMRDIQFGDVTLELPGTKFVGYSRQVFGLKLHGEHKNIKFWGIGSQSKGSYETKEFYGNRVFERVEILDINYIKKKYYDIAFATPIAPGTERVYLDDRDVANNYKAFLSFVVRDFAVKDSTYTGDFHLLTPGQDYTIDYTLGIITFKVPLAQNYYAAIEYKTKDGRYVEPTIIKTENDQPIKDENELGYRREIKNYYFIGKTTLERDDGKGNFILKIVDQNRNEPTILVPGNKEVPQYPKDIVVDFETGIFCIFSPSETYRRQPFPDEVYLPSPKHFYKILIEYRHIQKTYMLRPMIVPYSERIEMDGQLLERDRDYFIDYDSGFITFVYPERITDKTRITASYEYSLFGLGPAETLLGARIQTQPTQNSNIGATVIGNLPRTMERLPDPRTQPSSLLVYTVDGKISDVPFGPFKVSVSGEYAESNKNPNIMRYSIIDSMEGAKAEDYISLYKDLWQRGYCPHDHYYADEIKSIENERVGIRDINPNALTAEELQTLKINYKLSYSSAISLVHNISPIGVDFSKKTLLEVWIYSDSILPEIEIQFGSFNEDADRDNFFDTEDKNKNSTLDYDEDIGIEFNNPTGFPHIIGKLNGLLDTEDLDKDGMFDTEDKPIGTYKIQPVVGWRIYQIPLNIQNEIEWTNIKQIRLTIKRTDAFTYGTIKIAKISIIGNKWENLSKGNLEILTENNEDSPQYPSLLDNPIYKELYRDVRPEFGERRITEQTLKLKYTITPATPTVMARQIYLRPQDFSTHKKFRFFLHGDNSKCEFFIKIGNPNNYFKFSKIIDFTGWKLIEINQVDINKDERPDLWEVDYSIGVTTFVGSPSFTNITQIIVGLTLTLNQHQPIAGSIYINEIHLSDPWERKGHAMAASLGLELPGWFKLSLSGESLNRNFQTFTQSILNQDKISLGSSISISKLRFLPTTISLSFTKTDTPSAIEASDLLSIQDEKTKIDASASLNTKLALPYLPPIDYSYTKSLSSSSYISRTDITDTHRASLSFTNPLKLFFLPKSIFFSGSISKTFLNPWKIEGSTATVETVEEFSTKLPFSLKTISFNIENFSLKKTYAEDLIPEEVELKFFNQQYPKIPINPKYEKSAMQNLNSSLTLGLHPFFSPNFTYSSQIQEIYNFPKSTHKTIQRNITSSVSNSFYFNRLLPKFKPTSSLSLTASYSITDADNYELVESTYPTILNTDVLWIRNKPLKPTSIQAYRKLLDMKDSLSVNLTHKPLEFLPLPHQLQRTHLTLIYTESQAYSEQTQTVRQTLSKTWPHASVSLFDIEQLFKLQVIRGSRTDFTYVKKFDETMNYSRVTSNELRNSSSLYLPNNLTLTISFSHNFFSEYSYPLNKITRERETNSISSNISFVYKAVNISPSLSISFEQEYPGKKELFIKTPMRDLTTLTLSTVLRHDTSFPQGIEIPFLKRTLPLTNRLSTNANINYTLQRSRTDLTRGNTDNFTFSLTSDYETSPNIRVGAGMGFGVFLNQYNPRDNHTSFNLSTRLTIMF